MGPRGEWVSAGVQQEITPVRQGSARDRHDATHEYAMKSQTHMWVAIVHHLLSDSDLDGIQGDGGTPTLDSDSLLGVNVGCFICEEPFSPQLRKRRCTGEPS